MIPLSYAVLACASAFAAGIGAMLWADGRARGWPEDMRVGAWYWAIFGGAAVAWLGLGWWRS